MLDTNAFGMSIMSEAIITGFLGLKITTCCSVITSLAAGMIGAKLLHHKTK